MKFRCSITTMNIIHIGGEDVKENFGKNVYKNNGFLLKFVYNKDMKI